MMKLMSNKYVKLHKCRLKQDNDQSKSSSPKPKKGDHEKEEEKFQLRELRDHEAIIFDDHNKQVGGGGGGGGDTPRSTKLVDAMNKLMNIRPRKQPSKFAAANNNIVNDVPHHLQSQTCMHGGFGTWEGATDRG